MGFLFPAGILIGALALAGWIAYAAHVAEKKRAEELQRLADELAFEYLPQGDPSLFQSLGKFQLFSQGRSKRLWNLLRGTTNDLEVAIFDYRYVTGSGKHSHTWNHTVISFRFTGQPLPHFSLRPENFADKIGGWFGYQDIDFETHPAFSKQYLLRGASEAAIRALFTGDVLNYFEQKPGLTTEASENTLLFYRHSALLKPQEVRSFMEQGFGVLSQFHAMS
jgi:hypothetical protein